MWRVDAAAASTESIGTGGYNSAFGDGTANGEFRTTWPALAALLTFPYPSYLWIPGLSPRLSSASGNDCSAGAQIMPCLVTPWRLLLSTRPVAHDYLLLTSP